jgi:hypothetical protein
MSKKPRSPAGRREALAARTAGQRGTRRVFDAARDRGCNSQHPRREPGWGISASPAALRLIPVPILARNSKSGTPRNPACNFSLQKRSNRFPVVPSSDGANEYVRSPSLSASNISVFNALEPCRFNDQRLRLVVQEALCAMGELERRMMRLGNWPLSLVCGNMGVFTLWFSFIAHSLIPYAVGFLGIGLALEIANHRFLAAPRR